MKFGKLEVAVFVAGFMVMFIEIAGVRAIAPYLGDTLYSWTDMIGVVLASIAVGYYFGGWLADKGPDKRRLGLFLIISGIYMCLLPLFSGKVLGYSIAVGYEYGALFASIALFAAPNFLLGAVLPYAIRLKTTKVEKVGGNAGDVAAIETIGSILGAFLTGYFLVPSIGLDTSFFSGGIILVLVGIIVFGRKAASIIAAAAVIVALQVVFAQPAGAGILYSGYSPYYYLQVLKYNSGNNTLIALRADTALQTIDYASNYTSTGVYEEYTQLLYDKWPNREGNALVLGLGGGSDVLGLYRNTNANITAVEIDPDIVRLAYKYFDLPHSSRIKIYTEDARYFLRTNKEKYNLIIMDAFGSSISMPFWLTSIQAAQEMKAHLTENGSVIEVLESPVTGPYSAAFKSVYQTYNAVFPYLYVFPLNPEGNLSAYQTVVIIASNHSVLNIPSNLSELFYNTTNSTQKNIYALEGLLYTDVNASGYKPITDNLNPYQEYAAEALNSLN